jgi:hypothetical protein
MASLCRATQSDATGLNWPLALRAPGLQLPTQDVFDGLSYGFQRAFRNVSIQQYRKTDVAGSSFEATLCAVFAASSLPARRCWHRCATKRVNLDPIERLG